MVNKFIFPVILCLLLGKAVAQNTMTTDSIFELPFTENFTSGSFETNQWTTESSNWVIIQVGDTVPAAIFSKNPPVSNYSSSLTSPWLNAENFIDGRIYMDFDLNIIRNGQSDSEFLYMDVFDGNEWIQKVKYFISYASPDWAHQSIDLTEEAMDNQFKVRFRAEGDSSLNLEYWAIDNINVYRKCMPPLNLQYSYPTSDPCLITLNWDVPGITGPGTNKWLSWNNGENYNGIGSVCGNCKTTVAIRFTPLQLYAYHNFKLTAIRFFPYDENGTITLKVWTGANASQLVLTQPMDSFVTGQWNEVTLDNPLTITNTDELWIGYDADVIMGSPVPGIDCGPSVSGYGDMISFNGSPFVSLSETFFLQGNWNLEGFVSNSGTQSTFKNTRSLTEYRVYRNNEYIGSTTDLTYVDNFSGYSWPVYTVTAVYADCESDFSNEVSIQGTQDNCNVGVEDALLNSINVYPNPSTDRVTIICSRNIRRFALIDMVGHVLNDYDLEKEKTTHISLSGLQAGVYNLRFESVDGRFGTKKVIVTQ